MSKFREWYLTNFIKINWFIIGFLIMGGIHEFGRGNYITACVDWVIAGVNWYFDDRI